MSLRAYYDAVRKLGSLGRHPINDVTGWDGTYWSLTGSNTANCSKSQADSGGKFTPAAHDCQMGPLHDAIKWFLIDYPDTE